MIRINLFQGRLGAAKGIESMVALGRPASFVSRLELLLGALFLLLGSLILVTQVRNSEPAAVASADESPGAGSPSLGTPRSSGSPDAAGRQSGSHPNAGAEVVSAVSSQPLPGQQAAPEAQAAPDSNSSPAAQARPAVLGVTPEKGQEANLEAEPKLMSSLFVTSREDSVRIFVATGSHPAYQGFRLDHPNRVVVDLPGVRVSLPSDKREQAVSHPLIKRVRAAQYKADPPIARVVLDVTSFPNVEYLPQFNGLYIKVSEIAE